MSTAPVPGPTALRRRGLVAAGLADEVVAGGDRRDAALQELTALCRQSGAKVEALLKDASRRSAEADAGR